MPVLTIKGMPQGLYRALKKRAAEHRRSLNSEILLTLEQSIRRTTPDVHAWLAELDRLHARIGPPKVTDRQIRADKNWGRD